MAYTALNQGFLIEGSAIDTTSSTSYDLDDMILDVMIKKDYTTTNFPLFVIDLKTTSEVRDFIRDNEVRINLKIYVYNIDENNETSDEDNEELTITDTYYSGVIRIYDKPYTTTSAKTEEDSDSDDANTQTQSAPFVYYRISGIPEELIEKNSTIINEVYSSVSMDDVLVNVLSSVDAGNLYIESSDNKEIKKSIFIPPSTLTQSIGFLNENYQIYNGPCCVFLDTDCSYVYNPLSSKSDATNVFEYKVMNVDSSANTSEYLKTTYDASTGNLRMTVKSVSGFASEDRIVGNSIGSNVNYYSYDDNYNLVSRGNSSELAFDKTKYFWNPNRKQLFESAELRSIEKSAKALVITLRDVNPGYICPTTLFSVTSGEYAEVRGNFYPSSVRISFASQDLKHYSGITSLELFKK